MPGDNHRPFVLLAADQPVLFLDKLQRIQLVAQVGVEAFVRRAEIVGQGLQRPVGQLAEPIDARQSLVVGAGIHIDHTGIHAGFLVHDPDIKSQTHGDPGQGLIVGKGLAPDDGGALLGIECDEINTRLEITGDMTDTGETAPGNDLLDAGRIVNGIFDPFVATLPVGHRQVTGKRMLRCHIDHGAGHRRRGQRVVGRRLDEGIGTGKSIADNGHHPDGRYIAGNHVHAPRPERAHRNPDTGRCAGLLDPALQIVDAHQAVGHLADNIPVKIGGNFFVVMAENGLGEPRRPAGHAEGFLQVGVIGQSQALAQRLQVIQDIVECQPVEVRHLRRRRQGQLIQVRRHIRATEFQVAAAATENRAAVLDDPPADNQRNLPLLAHGHSPPELSTRYSMARLWASGAPAQSILSSPPSISLKRRISGCT